MSIVVTDLSFSFGSHVIFKNFSCRFEPGTATALVGPSGSGKSTLIALALGQLRPNSGTITYPPAIVGSHGVDQSQIAWVMQTSNLFARRCSLDNVALPIRCSGVRPRVAVARALAALTAVGLGDRAEDSSGLLSGGERQRVAVARALAARAKVLIADEPTVSLDHHNRGLLVDAILAAAKSGAVVVIATHDPAVYGVCDRVVEL